MNDVWSFRLRAGTTYRIAFESSRCASATLRAPGSGRAAAALRRMRCHGYTAITPDPRRAGRYTVEIEASGSQTRQAYRFRIATAGPDDVGVGVALRNRLPARGSLAPASVDVVDLYHFELGEPSDVRIVLARQTGRLFTVALLGDAGARLGRTGQVLERRLRPGRYVVAVRGTVGTRAGRYRVSLLARTVTATRVTVSGARRLTVTPGATVQVGVAVTPALARGRAELTIERFDPLTGWHFHRLLRTPAGATIAWRPPALGRWRIRARFRGTALASPSTSAYAYVVVSRRP